MKKIVMFLGILLTSVLLVACGKDKTFKVTFDVKGGTGEIAPQDVKEGGYAVKPPVNPAKENYTFEFWALEGETREWIFTSRKVEADTTLVAIYKEKAVTPVEPDPKDVALSLDFGTSQEGLTGYQAGDLTVPNTDGSSFKIKKDRVQVGVSTFAPHTTGNAFLVFAPRAGANYSTTAYAEFDLSNLDEISEISFEIAAWNQTKINQITDLTDATFVLEVKNGETWTKVGEDFLGSLTVDQYTKVTIATTQKGIYRLVYSAPTIQELTNTDYAIGLDNFKVLGKKGTGTVDPTPVDPTPVDPTNPDLGTLAYAFNFGADNLGKSYSTNTNVAKELTNTVDNTKVNALLNRATTNHSDTQNLVISGAKRDKDNPSNGLTEGSISFTFTQAVKAVSFNAFFWSDKFDVEQTSAVHVEYKNAAGEWVSVKNILADLSGSATPIEISVTGFEATEIRIRVVGLPDQITGTGDNGARVLFNNVKVYK